MEDPTTSKAAVWVKRRSRAGREAGALAGPPVREKLYSVSGSVRGTRGAGQREPCQHRTREWSSSPAELWNSPVACEPEVLRSFTFPP